MKKVVLFTIVLFIPTVLSASVCRQCLEEKVALWMQCLASPYLYRHYPNWCRKIGLQADGLYAIAKFCDKQLRFDKPSFKLSKNITIYANKHYMKEESTLPFNSCEACIYNTSAVYTLYYAKHCAYRREGGTSNNDNKPICNQISFCANKIATVFSLHPYLLAESIE